MDASITFLGTGGGRNTTASQARWTGGIILNLNNLQIHIDPGPGSLIYAKRLNIDVSKTSVFLVSHQHIDHANDINLLIDIVTEGAKSKKGHLITNGQVIKESLNPFHKNALEKISIFDNSSDNPETIIIDGIQISSTMTKNHDGAVGFKIKTANFSIGYTSDSGYFADLSKQFKGCDILIINNLVPFGSSCKYHLSSSDTVKFLNKINPKPKLAIITHFSQGIIKANPIYEAREIKKQTGVQVIAASDGMIIDPISYAIEEDQKSLWEF